jgi:hypothetical protein
MAAIHHCIAALLVRRDDNIQFSAEELNQEEIRIAAIF